MLRNKKVLVIFSSIIILCSSCLDFSSSDSDASTQDFSPILEKQELFEKKLNQIVKKLDDLQTSIKNIKIPASQANNKPEQKQHKRKPADPNYVHNIPQGDSFFIGNPDAKVTITEFYDFQ